jgi:hypothetical protein
VFLKSVSQIISHAKFSANNTLHVTLYQGMRNKLHAQSCCSKLTNIFIRPEPQHHQTKNELGKVVENPSLFLDLLTQTDKDARYKLRRQSAAVDLPALTLPFLGSTSYKDYAILAGEVIARNLAKSTVVGEETELYYFTSWFELTRVNELIERGDEDACIHLSLLVHASKCAHCDEWNRFSGFARLGTVRTASAEECPPKHIHDEAIMFLNTRASHLAFAAVNESIMQYVVPEDAPYGAVIHYVMCCKYMRAWSCHDGIVINIDPTAWEYLSSVGLAVLMGHELAHFLERRTMQNLNATTSRHNSSRLYDCQDDEVEAGYVFEVSLIGSKHSNLNTLGCKKLLTELSKRWPKAESIPLVSKGEPYLGGCGLDIHYNPNQAFEYEPEPIFE